MKVKVYSESKHPLPAYKTSGSCGMDVYADLEEAIVLEPLERVKVPTGLYFEIPEGVEAQVRARSGLSLKQGLTLINGIGTIDSDYRGELCVLMVNLSKEEVTIEDGERIAQIVFTNYLTAEWEEVDAFEALSSTDRGEKGLGHTGLH
ncbi:MAG: dUTP diphosphatase [Peptoniphilus sp.]|nr:dUTP diphosphatase [Peptoniphilus sp.]MDD7362983.1 dUTP diphosphatase [Bacillota bacterium]MDY6044223.1 dUTP diphosphatase [Peptoniphilus sp.]